MNGKWRMIGLYAQTLRHLRPKQIAWRLLRRAQRGLPLRVPAADAYSSVHFDGESLQRLREFLAVARGYGLDADADPLALRDDIFTFLNQTVDCEAKVPWQDKSLSRLWRYQLHGFRMARMLAAAAFSDKTALGDAAHAARWVEDWVRHNPPGAEDAWDPHPTAERLFNWVLSSAAFGAGYGATASRCALQADWLEARLEYDLCANHLLKEVMALALVAEVTGNIPLRQRAWVLVEEQVAEQILPDGGHYERSPMYHAQALFDGLVLRAAAASPPGFFDNALRRMTHFLGDILHPDGDIPLFSDAALGETMPGRALVDLSRELLRMPPLEDRPALPDSGFYALGSGQDRMILKAVAPSPAHQPGHAHADPFTFELSVAGTRLIVDGGCHGYAESPLRGYCRSVRAHNTVRINGQEPMEAWDVFRVARRHRITAADWEVSGHASILRGTCRWQQGWTQTRYARYDRDTGFWVVVDRVDGGDPLAVESFLHFHPGTELTETDGAWIARRGDARLGILPEGADRIERVQGDHAPEQGWYCPRFGVAEPAPTLVLHGSGAGRLTCGWMLFPPEGADRVVAALETVRRDLRGEA